MAKSDAPTVFGKRMRRTCFGGWHGTVAPGLHYAISPGSYVAGGGIIWESSVGDEDFKAAESLSDAARDIERKLTRLRKRLERMGA